MTTVRVAIVGASGETGQSIVNGLLQSTTVKFELFALTRPASLSKPANVELEKRGVKIIPIVLTAPEENLIEALTGIDVIISAILPLSALEQIPLANAAKRAGVKRFIPSNWQTVMPPVGIMDVRELKERVLNHLLLIGLPYTMIDVGWWYQVALPPVPSGRLDYCVAPALRPTWALGRDGRVPSALTDPADIGRYVARIIADPRTLNKRVFAYNEVLTRNEVYDVLEKVSGERLERTYVTEEEGVELLEHASSKMRENPNEFKNMFALAMAQYFMSWGIRGDNTPEYARYLGYLDCKELYPEIEFNPFEKYVQSALDGTAKPVLMDY